MVFVDKSGTYLIVEGDEMFVGEENEKTFSNFYYSQIESVDKVNLDYFQNGHKFLSSTEDESTLDYCGEAMQNFAQAKIASTQYSTIYDLDNLIIRVYLFNDYSEYIDIDLKVELEKGNHRTMIAKLFPEESIGHQHYLSYNNPAHPTLFIEELIGESEVSEEEFNAMQFGNILSGIGEEWLNDIKKPEGAINVFKYGVKLMPNNFNLHDSLGEAYFSNKDWTNSIKSYAKSLSLNPENINAIEMISKANKNREEQTN
jgi:tetratricopeptide (TPR) repeat protein